MTFGEVSDLQAWVEVAVYLPNQRTFRRRCVVDTGFQGQLALPSADVAAAGLTPSGRMWVKLADDSHASVALFDAAIIWNGEEVTVTVMAMGQRPLIGAELLEGYNLSIDFEEDGEVALTPL